MPFRRAFFVWQFAAAVLPIWLLTGYALWGATFGGLFGVVLLVPIVVVVELALALLFSARPEVRRRRAMDGPGMAVIGAYQLAVVGFGFFGPATAWFGVLAALAAIGGLWLGGSLLVNDLRARVRATMAGFGRPPQAAPRTPIDAGEYIVVKPAR